MRNKVSIYIFFIFLQSIGNAAEGSLDTSFDTDGIVTTTINSGGDYAYDVAVQPDGKIVVVGYTNSGSEYDLAIVRYNEDGSLDASFDNDGIKVIDIGQEDFGQSVVLQSDGKILIGGTTRIGSNDFLLVRLNSDGSLDTSFDSDGIVITSISTTLDYGKALAIQSDGKILLAGHSHDGSYYNVTLVRYNTDGSLDTSFDSDGIATASAGTASDYAEAIILDSSGKILVAGYSSMGSSTDFSIYRFNSDGSLDTSFDSDGKKTIDFSSGNDWGKDIAVQSDGKILISGYAVDSNGKQKFAIARLLADGSLDTSFDSDGLLLASVSSYHHSNGGIVIQSNGKILIGGEVDHSPSDIALVRLNTDGSYDSNFDLDGKLYTDLGSADYGNAIAIQPNDKLLVAGTSNSHFAVVRYILDEISPVTPINLIAAPGNQKVTLTWDQNSEADFGKYIIYGGTFANPTTKVDSTTSITDTTKTITGIANGTTYYYRITGVDNAGNESDYSNEVHVAPTIVDSGLVAYYPFTGNALDGSGNGKDGILGDGSDSNTYPSLTSDRFGTAGATYSFDGSDFINLNVLGSSLLPDNHDWTVSLWVNVDKIDFTSTGRFISSRDKTNKNGALLDVAAQIDNYPFRLIVQNQSGGSANTSIISSGLNRNDGNWHHLTGIFINNDLGNDTIKLIVDNGPVSVNSNIDYVINTDNNVYLGSETDRSSFLLGKLDDIRIYNRALTTSEIQTLYHEGDWDPAPAAPTGLTPAPGNQQVTLTWNQNTESDFAKYIIYGDTSASPTTKVDSTTSIIDTTITIPGLTNGTTYYYRITAVDSAGNESGYSNEVVLAPYDSSIPLVFSEYFSSNFDGSKWQFSSGSTGAYQSVNSDSGYIEIHSGTTSGGGGKVLSKDTFSLTANKTIIFKARCKTSNIDGGDWGLWGDNHEGQILFNVYYGGQTGIFAQVRENSTSTVTSVDLDHDSTLIDWHEYKLVCTYSNVMLFIDGVLETTITQNIPLNKPLRIRLDRVSWGTNEHITVDYVEIQSSDATIPSAPTGLTANPGNQQVTLTWNQNTESDFAKYYIYGGTSTSPTTKVDSTTSITDTTKTITSLTNGTTYYHRITALDNGGNESGYSNEVHVAPTIVDSGLVDYYPFNGNALDGSGNVNDGTEYGGVTLTPDRFGNAHSAFSFDGVDDYISYPYNTLNDLPKATVGIWVKINNYDNSHWLIFKGYKERSSADYAIKLESGGSGFDPGQVRIFVRDSDTVKGYLVSSSVKIPLNNWVYIVHTWDGNTHNLYLNGKLKESLSSTRTLWSNTDQGVFVGGGDSNGGNSPKLYWTNGDIDAIRIYKRALTTSEIPTLYHAGGWDPAPSAPTNLTVTPGNQQVTLTWNQNTESDFAKYIIYGGTSTNPTTKADSTTNITDTTKTITGLTNGITYYYRITAVDSAGNESGFSNEDSVTPHPVKYVVKTDSTGDFTTIQAGIDSSSNGDTVLVYEGTYLENINFNGKSIVLGSEFLLDADTSHISKTIIDGNQAGRVVTIENGEDSTTQLIGFTIQNGLLTGEFDQGAGINIAGSSEPVLSHLIIRNNKLTAFENIGGGINISSSGHPILRNSIIENNTGRDGAAIAGGSIIENVIIRNNHADPTSIGDIPGGSVTKLSNILFYNNFNGSAIYAEGGTFVLTNSIIIAPENNGTNFFSYGINLTEVGGITSNAFIINSIFWNKLNSPAITFSGANTLVKNITVSHSLIQGGQNRIQNQTGNTVNWLSGNLDVNPLFVDPLNGDFHLKSESHCIGAGIDSILIDTTWYYAPSTDFAGNPRPDPAGSRPDIGAFENSLGMPVFTPPTITKVYPPDDSTGVAVNANLRIIFSEPIFSDSGLISVKRSDGLNEQNIQVDSSALRITGNTVTVDLDSLGGNTSWYVLIDSTAFRDNAGNYFPGIASDTTWNFTTASEAAPTVTISSTESSPTNVTPIPITITFSKNVTGFDSTDVIITNASLSGFTGSGTTYAFDLIPAQDTTITVDIPAEVAQDDQGVGNAAAAQFSIVFNGTAPTVVISSSIASPTNVTPIPIGVTFSEPVTGFDSSDVAVVNGTLSTFTGTDSSYSFNLIPDQDGTVTINIAAGAAQDEAGNDNYAATQFSMVYDGTAPVLASLSPADNATNIATDADLVLTFTEVVQTDTGSITVKQKYDGFTVETIAVTSDSVTISEKSASIAITTLLDSTEYYILIDSTAFQDAAGNYFTGITSDTTWNFTTASPAAATVAMSSTLSSPTNVSPIPVTITFSDSVTGFDSTDVVVGNGTLTSFSGSGTTYILEVTPTIDGDVTVDIAANVALNNAGVGNASATQFSITYDGTAPEVVFSSSAAPATNSSTIPVSASLSESVTDFNSGMVDLSSGYITDFTLNGLNATFNIGGISEGVITVAVKDSAFQDLAHNYNTAVEYSIIYDATAPTPGIVNDGNGTDIDYQSSKTTITANWSGFKDLLSGIDSYQWAIGTSIGWIDVMNWTDVADTVTENTSLTLTNNQTYFIFVRARDAAGNLSPVAVSDGVTIDELPPTVGIPWEGTETTDVDWLSPNIVSIQWNQIQDESIAYYEYSIGKAPGDPDVVDWTPNSTDTMVTMTNLSLSEGVDYYSNLRAIDQAGNQSDVTSSDGFKVDGTAPIAGSVAVQDLVNSYYLESTSTITIQPSGFFDQASGIKTFKVGIGSSKGNNDLVSFVEVDSSGILTLNNLSLTDYQTCYCNVVAVDQVGNVSSLVTSPEFMTYETYLGDYNGDRQIDAIDLANLTVNWPNVDLGPVTGEPPYFIPQFDGVANLRDVMVFTRMWHWSKQSAGSTRIVAKVGSEPVVKQSGKTLIVTLPENTTTGSIELTYPVNLISVENQSESVSEKALSIFYNNEVTGRADLTFTDLSGNPVHEKQITVQVNGKNNVSLDLTYHLFNQQAEKIGSGTVPVEITPVPERFALHQNYPNPFNPITTIQYDLPQESRVELVIYNLMGQEVARLVSKKQQPGYYEVRWNGIDHHGRKVGSGIYFYALQAEAKSQHQTFRKVRKMVLLK